MQCDREIKTKQNFKNVKSSISNNMIEKVIWTSLPANYNLKHWRNYFFNPLKTLNIWQHHTELSGQNINEKQNPERSDEPQSLISP